MFIKMIRCPMSKIIVLIQHFQEILHLDGGLYKVNFYM